MRIHSLFITCIVYKILQTFIMCLMFTMDDTIVYVYFDIKTYCTESVHIIHKLPTFYATNELQKTIKVSFGSLRFPSPRPLNKLVFSLRRCRTYIFAVQKVYVQSRASVRKRALLKYWRKM